MKKLVALLTLVVLAACASKPEVVAQTQPKETPQMVAETDKNYETAILAGGCFWCTEAIYQNLKGVVAVDSGYTGGPVKNPTYKMVCSGDTGHAEGVKITFDPKVISYEQLLDVFWHTHDPTTLNRQGNDVGTQYRSAIYYLNDEQKEKAEKSKAEVGKSGLWDDPIVTEITAAGPFYSAETYHQDYYDNNQNQPYCSLVISPKLKKFRQKYSDMLKQ
ncbi:MAG: peptide-methionine (S)-S-oxide reductase MsrA [Vulcanimicrobiota bacterium]